MKPDSVFISYILLSYCWVICECRWANCNDDATYPNGGAYSINLKRVIKDLFPNNSDIPQWATSSYGESPNTAFALLQCVGNISEKTCSDCSKIAYNTVSEYCGNAIGGRVWMDDCFLRYDNSNFFNELDLTSISFRNKTQNISSNVSEAYKAAVTRFMQTLSIKAYEPANKGFAIGSTAYAGSVEVYGLVQCWRTLDSENCKNCLLWLRNKAQDCCSINIGAQFLSTSCKIRYETYRFFGSAESMLPLKSRNLPTSPPPASLEEPHSSGKLSKLMQLSLVFSYDPQFVLGFHEGLMDTLTMNISSAGKSSTIPIVLGLLEVLILAFVICLILMRKKVVSAISGRQIPLVTPTGGRQIYSYEARSILQEKRFVFSLQELAEYTQNFDDSNKLGVGGFGTVYKGTTREGNQIAVKKLSARSLQVTREFMNDVKLLANVQHPNLVKLLGCSAQGDERFLVYDYFPNRSLDTFLFDPEKRKELRWEKRHKIIIGIARGLIYLHENSQLKIIHRDIKANNILLDQKLNAKISDFGLARLFGGDETHANTKAAGTYGYMAPEYAMHGQLSVKADVYSFGVLLLEILSGRKNSDVIIPYEMVNLVEWAWRVYKGDYVENLVDPTIAESCSQEKARRFFQIGLLCVQADATLRPTMSNAFVMISSDSVRLPNPQKPAFIGMSESHGPRAETKLSTGSGVETSGTMTSSSSEIASVMMPPLVK